MKSTTHQADDHQPTVSSGTQLATLDAFAEIPEEEIWLRNFTSVSTRRSYRAAVRDFIRTVGLRSVADFRQVERAAVIVWRDHLTDSGASIRTVKTKLSALSSLFNHLVDRNVCDRNPVREVQPPKLRVRRGETKALSAKQARILLDAPPKGTLQGLRDRAILSVGLQVGARRAEIAGLRVEDLAEESGYAVLKLRRKGGVHGSVAIHQNVVQRIQVYLDAAGHAGDLKGPLFRPVRSNQHGDDANRHLHPQQVDRVFRRWCRAAGIKRGFTSHSMRATCATTALKNGASLEQVQDLLGHADPSTTKLYDRRGFDPEHSASHFVSF